MTARCDCYPGGFTPGTYEGPQRHCPVHGDGSGISAEDMWHQSCLQARAAFDVLMRQHRALRAERDGLVESIAAGFDARAHAAEVATRDVPRTQRDVDVVLAWYSGARFVRTHAAGPSSAPVEPQTRPGGTSPDPGVPGYAHAYTVTFDGDTHWLACDFCESPISPIEAADSLDEIVAKARDHERRCSTTRPATSPTDRCPSRIAHEDGAVLRCWWSAGHPGKHQAGRADLWSDGDARLIATSPTGDPTDAV